MSIEYIDIVCHNHTDYGYTDHPAIASSLLSSYLYEVLDAVEKYRDKPDGGRFCWTCETLRPVMDFYEAASRRDRERFTEAVQEGLIEVSGLPYNVTSLYDAPQWKEMLCAAPEELRRQWKIRFAMQNDINGLSRGGMQLAYDAGLTSVWVGPNTYNGAPPLPTPVLFDWQLDEGRTMRVWLNASYCDGFFLFEENWRQGPVPEASELIYRRPGPGDFFRCDETSVREAHAHCMRSLALIEGDPGQTFSAARDGFTQNKIFGGYKGSVLGVSVTNQWRVDNDPPCPWISDFVSAWNALGLRPALRLRTAGRAMDEIAAGWNGPVPAISGEWTDWWANGSVSMPAELSAARKAGRICRELEQPVFCAIQGQNAAEDGGCEAQDALDAEDTQVRRILQELILFNEHSFGSWRSVASPDSDKTLAQQVEKSAHAYRALAMAEKLFADRAGTLADSLKNGIMVVNPSGIRKNAAVSLPGNCLRTEELLWIDEETKEPVPMTLASGRKNFMRPMKETDFSPENISRTFSDNVPGQTVNFHLLLEPGQTRVLRPAGPGMYENTGHGDGTCGSRRGSSGIPGDLVIEKDDSGWPCRIKAGETLLTDGACGDFLAVCADGFSPRWTFRDLFDTEDEAQRRQMYREHISLSRAVYDTCREEQQGNSLRFTQWFSHPSLLYGKRVLTVDPLTKEAALEIDLYRKSDPEPQILYLAIDSPVKGKEVWTSNAGTRFRPGPDQIPGSCMDYYGIDEWIWYGESAAEPACKPDHAADEDEPDTGQLQDSWLIASADTPLVAFGEPTQPVRRTSFTQHPEHMYFQIYDNTWDTNFPANACGKLSFCFRMAAGVSFLKIETVSADLLTDPFIIVRMGYNEQGQE